MNALSRPCLTNLCAIGFRSQLVSASAMSLAARCRIALSSSAVQQAMNVVQQALDSDEVLIAPPTSWRNEAMFNNIQQAYNTVHSLYLRNPEELYSAKPHLLQRTIILKYYSESDSNMATFLADRIAWWFGELQDHRKGTALLEYEGLAQDMMRRLKVAAKQLPHHVVSAYLKSVANAWVTSARMGAIDAPCVFGCGCLDGDGIRHMIVCPAFMQCAKRYMPSACCQWPACGKLPEALCLDEVENDAVLTRYIWHDIAMYSSNILRRRHYPLSELIAARIRALCRERARNVKLC